MEWVLCAIPFFGSVWLIIITLHGTRLCSMKIGIKLCYFAGGQDYGPQEATGRGNKAYPYEGKCKRADIAAYRFAINKVKGDEELRLKK